MGGAVAGVTVATTLAIICVYATLLRLVNPDRLRRALSYVHVVLIMAMFGAPVFMTEVLEPLFDIAQERGASRHHHGSSRLPRRGSRAFLPLPPGSGA